MTTARFRAMGCEVVVGGATNDELEQITRIFAGRDRTFSRFREDSELSRVNRFATRTLVVSDTFAEMLRASLWAAGATDGLVDPTVGASIVALGYDRDFAELDRTIPCEEPVAAGHWTAIDVQGRILTRPVAVQLDLNCVVKSRTVDDALELIAGTGFVSAGGDLAARGPLDVALPDGTTIRLERGGMATSGTLTRSWLRDGQRHHHLVDPATGRSAESPWTCVTVAATSCLVADVAAKAAFLNGDDGPEWLDSMHLPGRFLREDGTATVTRTWAAQATGASRVAA